MREPPAIGFDRAPRDLVRLLGQSGDNVAAAGAALHRLIDRGDSAALVELERREQEGDRIAHDLLHLAHTGRLSTHQRGQLLQLVERLDDVIDALEEAGHVAEGCDCGENAANIASVMRDLTRLNAQTVHALGSQSSDSELSPIVLARQLARQGRQAVQRATGEVLGADGDPLTAVKSQACLERLGSGLAAGVRAAEAATQMELRNA
jgi:hypothetical protein